MIPSAPSLVSLRELVPVAFLALAVSFPAAAIPPDACPDQVRVREASGLRFKAIDSAAVVAFLRADAVVQTLSCEAGLLRVDAGRSGKGWLSAEQLAPVEAAAADETLLPLDLLAPVEPIIVALVVRPPQPAPLPAVARIEPAEAPWDASISEGSVEPRRMLLLREEPRWGSAVAGRSSAGRAVEVLSRSELGWSLVDAGLDRPVWVVTAALQAPPLSARR